MIYTHGGDNLELIVAHLDSSNVDLDLNVRHEIDRDLNSCHEIDADPSKNRML